MEKCDESLGHKQAFGDHSFKEAELLDILRQVHPPACPFQEHSTPHGLAMLNFAVV